MTEPTNAELLGEIRKLQGKIEELEQSSAKFERLHTLGRVTLVVLLGFGSFISFTLVIANQIRSLFHS